MALCQRSSRLRAVARPTAWHADRWALLIDFEAWLEQGAPTHASVSIRTLALLGALHERLGGAVAFVSRQPIAVVDEYLYPLRAACAGLQGLERRDARGGEHRLRTDARLAHVRSLPQARDLVGQVTLSAFMAETPFAGRRPLWFGPTHSSRVIEHYVTDLGGAIVAAPSRRAARSAEPAFDACARDLLDDALNHEPVSWACIARASPSTAQ